MMTITLLLFLLCTTSLTHKIRVYNNCPFEIAIGVQSNGDKGPAPEDGGFRLPSYRTRDFPVSHAWAGRLWARTGCNEAGHCETGDCGSKIQCRGSGGIPPASLAEITFDGADGKDFYDVSLVDGYNLPIAMFPLEGTTGTGAGGKYDCGRAGCFTDLNAICPHELSIKNNAGWTIACKSACEAFKTDQYCCRGEHRFPHTCKPATWPKDYSAIFKQACPDAYSYAYDDTLSTFTCRSASTGTSAYQVTFCP